MIGRAAIVSVRRRPGLVAAASRVAAGGIGLAARVGRAAIVPVRRRPGLLGERGTTQQGKYCGTGKEMFHDLRPPCPKLKSDKRARALGPDRC